MPTIMDMPAAARRMADDVFTDPFERLSETDIFIQGPSTPLLLNQIIRILP
jgi:hypothetical protein